ncbi:hypothetical protein [Brevibacterium aurantiacum]|uniref:Uncharacterized protein n=1 Tax=Brevibacterium aurantiacum TaxID=273384 RepID=A0A368M044_BREAU|nr:hypothetical protein [Brevibacterium aurantiacum]AZT98105.1 hypothetical protein CXR27_14720 [Brevibacterium aurantiacum]RCS92255.1 hypothetical protein CIK61_17255 [Brevibacterium aurantiacum]
MNDHTETHRVELPETRPEMGEGAEADRSAFAVHRDPSLTSPGADPGSRVGRGIAWVRPTDLIASSTARIAGLGINFQTELAHRARRAAGQTYRATRNHARDIRDHRAAPAGSAVFESFDVFEPQDRPRSSSWLRPSGIGLG